MSTDDETGGTGRRRVDTALADSEPEPTGVATAVVVRSKRARPSSAPASTAKPRAKAKAKTDSEPAPRSRRAPVSAKKSPASKSGAAPRSRRSPRTRDEASIPPTWSDLDAHGDRIARTDLVAASPLDPTPLSPQGYPHSMGTHGAHAEQLDPALPISRLWGSAYAKAAIGIAAAVFLVLGARGLVRHRVAPMQATATASASPLETSPPVVAATEDTIAPPSDTLAEESADDAKHASLAALEQRKLDDAIAAGERATALDPTDAEAWLILGAAYQDQGNIAAARRSYASCAKQATRGEVRECTFLLQ